MMHECPGTCKFNGCKVSNDEQKTHCSILINSNLVACLYSQMQTRPQAYILSGSKLTVYVSGSRKRGDRRRKRGRLTRKRHTNEKRAMQRWRRHNAKRRVRRKVQPRRQFACKRHDLVCSTDRLLLQTIRAVCSQDWCDTNTDDCDQYCQVHSSACTKKKCGSGGVSAKTSACIAYCKTAKCK